MFAEQHSDRPRPAPATGRRRRAVVLGVLGVLPVVATLAVPVYSEIEPRVAGFPLFYWYQFACLVLTAVCLGLALVVVRAPSDERTGGGAS